MGKSQLQCTRRLQDLAMAEGHEVYVIADACGDVSTEAHEWLCSAWFTPACAPITAVQYLLERQRD